MTSDGGLFDPADRPPEEGERSAGSAGAPGTPEQPLDLDLDLEELFAEPEPVTDERTAKLLAERDEYLESLRRLQAEFDNYRKRTVRQQTELLERAAESLLERLLPVLDALDLALTHVGESDEGGETQSAFVQISGLLRDALAKDDLERIDAAGVAFDPTIHDAVAHVAGGESDETTGSGAVVDEVLRAGYRLKGRVLRPAMVKVRG